MNEIKTTTGTVRLVRDGIVIIERRYNYDSRSSSKGFIIDLWRHTYGKKFFECELQVIDKKHGKIDLGLF